MKLKTLLFFLLIGFTFFISQNYEKYTVKKGDSYYLIGQKFKINYLDIIKLNQGKKLVAGEVIRIPFYFYHTVKNDESLTFLARKYLVKVDEIIRLNDLKREFLYEGQQLKIPKFVTKIKIPTTLREDESFNPNRTNNYTFDPGHIQDLSFTWPVNGKVKHGKNTLSSFSENMNLGIPIKTLNNDTVYASEDGIIFFQGEIRGFGKVTLINHSGDLITAYMGVKEFYVYEKQVVQKGQPIAKSRKNLFFSIFLKGDPQNPTDFLNNSSI